MQNTFFHQYSLQNVLSASVACLQNGPSCRRVNNVPLNKINIKRLGRILKIKLMKSSNYIKMNLTHLKYLLKNIFQ